MLLGDKSELWKIKLKGFGLPAGGRRGLCVILKIDCQDS